MAIGIKLKNNMQIYLGEKRDILLAELDSCNIVYDITFDRPNKDNIKETIIHIKELGIEISIENDILQYIRAEDNDYTHIDKINNETDDKMQVIKNIQNKLLEKVCCGDYRISVEKLDMETMHMTLIITGSKEKARVQIIKDNFGDIFINTLRNI